jgi:hypothetical protein
VERKQDTETKKPWERVSVLVGTLRFATAKVNKVGRSGGHADSAGSVDDPWSSVPSPAMAGAGGTEPPF